MGALVTTLSAGMAFADWPSSDGHNMLLYPWFSDFAKHPDKFVEHGHRLAGMLIGFVSVCLAISSYVFERRWVKWFTTIILVSVIAQGGLGGARVLLDKQLLAMLHSMTGAAFFGLCVVFRLVCCSNWSVWRVQTDQRMSPLGTALVIVTPAVIFGQYLLGGALRHFHTMMDEHLVGAVLATQFAAVSAGILLRTENGLLRRAGLMIVLSLSIQILLGVGSYLTRFGLPQLGYVAVSGSLSQSIVCSLHTVGGMFLLASSVVAVASLAMLFRAGALAGLSFELPTVGERGTVA